VKKVLFLVIALLSLTGCATAPSLQDQAALIEYEACLSKQEKIQQEIREILFRKQNDLNYMLRGIIDTGKPDPKTGLITSLETMIGQCSKYRP
jgi:hypothetical protein